MLPKGEGEFKGIRLVEIIWKVFSLIMNNRLHYDITLHDAPDGCRKSQGIGTDTLEEKLVQQLAGICREPLFQVLLDVRKSYALLDRTRCMKALKGYGLGTKLRRLLQPFWSDKAVVSKAGRFYGRPFKTGRLLKQGYPVSPAVFNIVVEAVVRELLLEVCGPQEAQNGIRWATGEHFFCMNTTVALRSENPYWRKRY